MIKKIYLIFLLPLSLYASQILSYNIYDRTDRADIMITFDIPYEGVIKKIRTESKIIIKLQDAKIESAKLKKVSSKYIKTLAITPLSGYVQIIASVSNDVVLKVSKTSDSYGLRLRFQEATTMKNSNSHKSNNTAKNNTLNNKTTGLSSLPTKKVDDMTQSYYTVMAILVVGIIILFILKKKITPKNNQSLKQNELNLKGVPSAAKKGFSHQDSEVSIRFQKSIDEKNSVVMLDFLNQSYLVMMGSSNVLLDRFSDEKPTSQEEFNIILQDHQHMLDNFLNSPQVQKEDESNVKSYSQKASSISYDV